MNKINYKNDFNFILRLQSCNGEAIGWPGFDWTAKFYTSHKVNAFVVSCIGGHPVNCFNDNGLIRVVMNNHKLGAGTLNVEFAAMLPDEVYPDGTGRIVTVLPLDIELIRAAAPCPEKFDIEMALPALKGEKGDPGDAWSPSTATADELSAIASDGGFIEALVGNRDFTTALGADASLATAMADNTGFIDALAGNTRFIDRFMTASGVSEALTTWSGAISRSIRSGTLASSVGESVSRSSTAARLATSHFFTDALLGNSGFWASAGSALASSSHFVQRLVGEAVFASSLESSVTAASALGHNTAFARALDTNRTLLAMLRSGTSNIATAIAYSSSFTQSLVAQSSFTQSLVAQSSFTQSLATAYGFADDMLDAMGRALPYSTGDFASSLAANDAFVSAFLANKTVESAHEAARRQLFIEKWIKWGYVFGVHYSDYNEQTGFFELNGLTDIGYDEADRILAVAYRSRHMPVAGNFSFEYDSMSSMNQVRTLMPFYYNALGGSTGDFYMNLSFPRKLQVLHFAESNFSSFFLNAPLLTKLTGLGLHRNKINSNYLDCPGLVTFEGKNLDKDIDLSKCPKIDYESYKYIVDNRYDSNAVVITTDANTYAALTGEYSEYPFKGGTQEQWQQLLTDAQTNRQISFVTA